MSEVVELNDSIELLTKKLNEAEDCRAQLVKARWLSSDENMLYTKQIPSKSFKLLSANQLVIVSS